MNNKPPYIDIWVEADPVDYIKIKSFVLKWGYEISETVGKFSIVCKREKSSIVIGVLKSIGLGYQNGKTSLIIIDRKKFKQSCNEFKL